LVDQVDATRIVISADEDSGNDDVSPVDIYSLLKFSGSR